MSDIVLLILCYAVVFLAAVEVCAAEGGPDWEEDSQSWHVYKMTSSLLRRVENA